MLGDEPQVATPPASPQATTSSGSRPQVQRPTALLAHHPQWPPREAGQQLHAKLEAQPPALDSQPPAGKNPTTMLQAQLLASFLQSSAAQAPPGGAPVSLPLQLLQAEQLLHAEQMRVHEHHQQQEHLAQQQQQQAHALQQHLLRQAQHQQLLQQLVETQVCPPSCHLQQPYYSAGCEPKLVYSWFVQLLLKFW